MKSFQKTILEIIEPFEPRDILDLPCGNGWLAKSLKFNTEVDGIDLYDSKPENYRNFQRFDLDKGLPENRTNICNTSYFIARYWPWTILPCFGT